MSGEGERPKRIQRKRSAGWRMPEGAVYVGRPTKWGNPYTLSDVSRRFPSLTDEQCAVFVVNEFSDLAKAGKITDSVPDVAGPRKLRMYTYPVGEIAELRGKDLACWCRIDRPCHADVLLRLANA